LEERIEAWLKTFRQELEDKTPEEFAEEARGVVVQLKEEDTKLSSEVGSWWNSIAATEIVHERMSTPAFDRLERLADELNPKASGLSDITMNGSRRKSPEELKERINSIFDEFFAADAPARRAMSSRVFNHESRAEYEESLTEPGVLSTFSDMRYLKDFLSTWPVVPYWRKQNKKSE
jgi:secreted Zn-dependent insulinase-like peptidase